METGDSGRQSGGKSQNYLKKVEKKILYVRLQSYSALYLSPPYYYDMNCSSSRGFIRIFGMGGDAPPPLVGD